MKIPQGLSTNLYFCLHFDKPDEQDWKRINRLADMAVKQGINIQDAREFSIWAVDYHKRSQTFG